MAGWLLKELHMELPPAPQFRSWVWPKGTAAGVQTKRVHEYSRWHYLQWPKDDSNQMSTDRWIHVTGPICMGEGHSAVKRGEVLTLATQMDPEHTMLNETLDTLGHTWVIPCM